MLVVVVHELTIPEHRTVLRGPRVTLRGPESGDAADRVAAGRDPEYRRMIGADMSEDRPPMTVAGVEESMRSLAEDVHSWVVDVGGKYVGIARLHRLDRANRRARFAIAIFNRDYWNRGFGTEATQLVLQYAFKVLGLHRVDLRVLSYNKRAIAAYEKAGFVREGIERECEWLNGEWASDVWMSILDREFSLLQERASEEKMTGK